jgi:hypothetical protein
VYPRVTRVPSLLIAIGGIAVLTAGCSASSSTASSGTASGSATSSSATSHSSASGGASTSASGATPQQAILLASKAEQSDKSFDATISVQGTASTGSLSLAGTLQEQLHPSLLAEMDVSSFTTAGQTVPGGLSEIITPDAFYMKFPELMKAEHIAEPWAEFKLSEMGASGSTLQSLFSQLQSSSPATQTIELATSKNVRKVGTSVIDGVPVTEYAGSYSISQALAALPASERSALSSSVSASGISSSQFQIWIDGSNQPRKIVINEDGTAVNETTTVNVTSYNQPVTIQLPTAAQTYVIPASQLGSAG